MKKIVENIRAHFEAYGGEKIRNTFKGELRYEIAKLSYLLLLTLFVWLPYIPNDMILHRFPRLVVSIRIICSVLSFLLITLRFTKRFKHRPDLIMMVFVSYLYLATALITATSGEYAASYIGGFTFIIMVPCFAPFTKRFTYCLSASSLVLFFLVGTLTGLPYSELPIRYAVTDLFVAFLLSLLLTHTLNGLRLRAWEQRMKLKDTIKQNEKSLSTILNLANKAEASDRAKSSFLATMSHEIRTPMNAIIGIVQMQLQKGELSADCADSLERIYGAGNNLLSIINDILDMSKIESGNLELNPAEYDLPSLINDAVQLNIVRIGSKPVEFLPDIDPNLPSRLFGDELRLKQILNNLLSNAIKYTDKGYVKLSLRHVSEDENALLIFAVEDTGQGMRPEDSEKLFSEYCRFNIEANRAKEGTGLGLSITKKLVEMMNGEITAVTEFGKGSTFTVSVRQKIISDKPIGAQIARSIKTFRYTRETGERRRAVRNIMPYGSVLIVDDVETNIYVVDGLLSAYKVKTESANSGLKALQKVQNGAVYDIIFMDHMMPEMDGIEATKRIREFGYTGAIVALTANALAGNEKMFEENGFDAFIPKPIDVRKLDEVLNRYIRDRHPENANKYKIVTIPLPPSEVDPKLIKIFCRDADRAIKTIRETLKNEDISLFTTTVHAMKSALANVGEHKASAEAFRLEKAGLAGMKDAEGFIKTLEALLERLRPMEAISADNDIPEDTDFLREQLEIFKNACENYDDETAYKALDRLKEKSWKKQTADALEEIRDMLFLHSDFEAAEKKADPSNFGI